MAVLPNDNVRFIRPDGTTSPEFRRFLLQVVEHINTPTLTPPASGGACGVDDDFVELYNQVQGISDDLDALEAKSVGWKDLTSAVSSARVPPSSAPTSTNFGPAHTPQRREFAFTVGDYVFLEPFHVNHDILNAEAYIHVHWATDGTDNGNVQWEMTILRALGHDQANFSSTVVKTVEEPASGTAWRHMVTEVGAGDALTFTEPDELLLVTLRRIAASTDECTDTVFGLTVDFHYYSDRDATPQRAPNFYTP